VRGRLLGAAALLLSLAVVPAAQPAYGEHVFGPQRILVVLATWGPQPFAREEVRHVVFEQSDEIYRDMSYGKASLVGDVTPWLNALKGPDCAVENLRAAGNAAAAAAGFNPRTYDRIVYLHPDAGCPWSGATRAAGSFLNGTLTPRLVVHELGHSFGLGHANTTECLRHNCGTREYGDPYDTMGSGSGDFSAKSKFDLGWLTHVSRPARRGVYGLAPLERPATSAQAFVVTIAGDEYWIEYRTGVGVLVRVSPGPDARGLGASALPDVLLANPAGRHRPELKRGDRFAIRGVFSMNVLQSEGSRARLRFTWTDKVAPRAPRFTAAFVGGRLQVTVEETRERGSGVGHYQVTIDRESPVLVGTDATDRPVIIGRPLPGTHTVRVVAVDRAGNRSRAAERQVRVR
jgi:Gametolysin peptidase M11